MDKAMKIYMLLLFNIFIDKTEGPGPDPKSIFHCDSWGSCTPKTNSIDQNCIGKRTRLCKNELGDFYHETDNNCKITHSTIDGGYHPWSEWGSCNSKCIDGTTTKSRLCNNPTPCNGGRHCTTFLGHDTETKDCGPVDGGWSSWGGWSSCLVPGSAFYGTGSYTRSRTCTNPEPQCGGFDCNGDNTETGNCRHVPPCLTSLVFDERFLHQSSPMIIYTSTQVDLYALTKNKCLKDTTLYYHWNMQDLNGTSVGQSDTVKYSIYPGAYPLGLYQIYVKIGYPETLEHWVDETMYLDIQHPPPHVFIKGGAGRTTGNGKTSFDASSVSHSLDKLPGDSSGLNFDWKCLNFSTKSIYNLLEFNIDPALVFNDYPENDKKWYETSLYQTFKNGDLSSWLRSNNIVYSRINTNIQTTTCQESTSLMITADKKHRKSNYTVQETKSLKYYYGIDYLSDRIINYKALDLPANVVEPDDYELFNNGFYEFLDTFSFSYNEAIELKTRLAFSTNTLSTLMKLRNLTGLPDSADATFFDSLEVHLTNIEQVENLLNLLEPHLRIYEVYDINKYFQVGQTGKRLSEHLGAETILPLYLGSIGHCLLDMLWGIMTYFMDLEENYNWHELRSDDIYYSTWMEQEFIKQSSCLQFNETNNGFASLHVTSDDVNDGMGFLVYVKAEYESSKDYFIQHVQSINGNPPTIDIECRLNCMKKIAITSMMSLRATCSSCTDQELINAQFSWDVKNFDLQWRTTTTNTLWTSWMLTEQRTKKFVLRDNVLTENAGYLIEITVNTGNSIGLAIWVVTTDMLPRGGTCDVTAGTSESERLVEMENWKDEGFRYLIDDSIDWKEQLQFRIVQNNGNEKTLLYYGYENVIYINIKPGDRENDYQVKLEIQIVDIFRDYFVCEQDLGQIIPSYSNNTGISSESVYTYMDNSELEVDYYFNEKNVKQVALNTEIAGSSLNDLEMPETVLNIGVENLINLDTINGVNSSVSFENLWDMYLRPDQGDVDANKDIKTSVDHFLVVLDEIAEIVDGTSSVNIEQVTNSIGTIIQNNKFVANISASKAFTANSLMLDKFRNLTGSDTYPKYEDYISTCIGTIKVLNNALEAVLPKQSNDIPRTLDIYSIQEDISARQQFVKQSNDDLTLMEKAFLASNIALQNNLDAQIANDLVKEEVTRREGLLKSLEELGTVLQMLNFRKQLPVDVQKEHISILKDTKSVRELVQYGMNFDSVGVDFVETEQISSEDFNVQATTLNNTPFSWDEESKYITSKTLRISVDKENKSQPVVPSKLKFKNSQINSTKTILFAIPTGDEAYSYMLIYKMYWKNVNDSLIFYVSNAIVSLRHIVYVRKKEAPTEQTFDWMKTVNETDWLSTRSFGVTIHGDLFTDPGTVFIGLIVKADSGIASANTSVTATVIEYKLIGITTGCRVWDDKHDRWDRTACRVSSKSTFEDTVCECTRPPSNNFATTFYVPPNTIDFSTVFSKFDLKDNAAVFATVVSLVIVYTFLCIWALRKDKKDPEIWAISHLTDNDPTDTYLYLITVYTGLRLNAGTKSNVAFVVISHDKKTSTDVRSLDDGKNHGFGTGSVRRFIMSVPIRIKDPSTFYIWHDNSGNGQYSSWYLDKICLQDLQRNERFLFICNDWLSIDDEHSQSECTLPVLNRSEMKRFSFRFHEETRKNTTENHLWLSTVLRPEESQFTRVQRLACTLALLFLTMISNAMFYQRDTGTNYIEIGDIQLSLSTLFVSLISVLITFPPLFIATHLFRNSKPRTRDYKKSNKDHMIKNKRLPYACRFVAWILITAGVIVPGFFLILYSMEWGKSKSNEWLINFCLSFVQSVVFVEPVKILLFAVLFSCLLNSQKNGDIVIDREKLQKDREKNVVSPVSYFIGVLKRKPILPLKQEELMEMRTKRKQILTAKRTMVDIVIYLLFLGALYVVSFNNRDPTWFISKQHLDQELIRWTNVSIGDSTIRLEQVNSASSFYSWVNDTLLPFMFPTTHLTGTLMNANERLFVKDQNNYRVGPLRLRQQRAKEKENCRISDVCFDKYNILHDDEMSYCVGWKIKPCNRGENVHYISSDSWTHLSSLDVWGYPKAGLHATYDGGGFMSDFIVNFNISRTILNELYKNAWIDRKTRAVFTEFTLYNANNNVYIYVSLLCEFLEVGGVLTTASIWPFRPYQHVGSNGVFVLACELCLVVGCVVFIIKSCVTAFQSGRKYFKQIWNILDILMIILFIFSLSMYIVRYITVNETLEIFEKNKNKFVNFAHIALWDEIFNVFLSTLIFLTTFRVMRVLSYNGRINEIGTVLSNVSKDLCGCFLIFIVIYAAFLVFGQLIFGRELETYRNMFVSSTTLLNAVIGKNSINDLFRVEPIIGRIYYFLFVLFVLWIMMTILNATLNFGITHVRQHDCKDVYGISSLIYDYFNNIKTTFKNPRGKSNVSLYKNVSDFSEIVNFKVRRPSIPVVDINPSRPASTSLSVKG